MAVELTALRQKAHSLLDQAGARGLLSPQEKSRRKTALDSAKDFESIDQLVCDILQDTPDTALEPQGSGGSLVLPPRAASVLCIMAERKLRTPALGDQTTSLTVMGSTVLNLSEAVIDRPVVLDTLTVMGETVVILPPGTPADLRVVPVMGAVTEDKKLVIGHEGPRVIIQGAVIMGELRVSYQ